MVYGNMRFKVGDYKSWRKGFDDNESVRRVAGATGTKLVYQDADDANTVTLMIEWDNAENARKFFESSALREMQAKAGLTNPPSVRTILTSA